MKPEKNHGRWVILVGDQDAPVFWGDCPEALEHTCEVMKRTCPSARIVWQPVRQSARQRRGHTAGMKSRD